MTHDPKIKLLDIPEHFGNDTKPKNYGISQAQGEYVAFLDDDNTWRPDHLYSLYKCLDENVDISVAYGDRWVHNEIDPEKNGIGYFQEGFTSAALMQKNFIDTSDVLVRRAALQHVGGFDERYKKWVDWNLWIRLDKARFAFKRVPLILSDYYLHKESKSFRIKESPEWNPIDLEIRLPYLGEVKPPRVAIFSLTYDRLEYTKTCFESLYKTAGYPFDHFIVDNGSTDGTVEWLGNEYPKLSPGWMQMVYRHEVNKGISVASNKALDLISQDPEPYDIIGKVDNDAFFLTEGWLKRMVELWERNHRLAMSCYVQGLRDNPGGAHRENYGQVAGELLGMTRHVGGICVFADAKAWKDFRHDEQMALHSVQDIEFSQHLRQSGFQCCYLENFFLEHFKGTEGQEKDYPDYFERRKAEKTLRYGVK